MHSEPPTPSEISTDTGCPTCQATYADGKLRTNATWNARGSRRAVPGAPAPLISFAVCFTDAWRSSQIRAGALAESRGSVAGEPDRELATERVLGVDRQRTL